MLLFERLAEQRIRDAIDQGDMLNLPGAGQLLVFDDEPFVTPERRMLNHIMKRAGLVPSDVSMRKAIAALRQEIKALAQDDPQSEAKRLELSYLLVQADEHRPPA
jgi:hypothetical protein